MKPFKKHSFKVIRPPLTWRAMCIYKMTFSSGYYYIGGTSDLSDRITKHLLRLSAGSHSLQVNAAFKGCDSVTFEFVEFVNDRSLLNTREKFHLLMNVGRKKCLNVETNSSTAFGLHRGPVKIAQMNSKYEIYKIYTSITDAAKSVNYRLDTFRNALRRGTIIRGIIFRGLDKDNCVIEPPKIEKYRDPNCKPVIQYDLSMNEIKRFMSIGEAERGTKVSRRSIATVAQNKQKTTHGFIFKYEQSMASRVQIPS